MAYAHIDNLYKDQTILLFRECFALEKIHGCVKKGTLILMADGSKLPIEDIKPKDKVLSYDTKKRKFVPTMVEALVIQERDLRLGWMEVTIQDGRSIVCTTDHPFLTRNRGWVVASELTVEDDILTFDEK